MQQVDFAHAGYKLIFLIGATSFLDIPDSWVQILKAIGY